MTSVTKNAILTIKYFKLYLFFILAIDQLGEILQDQLSYYPPINTSMRRYYDKLFKRKIRVFVLEKFDMAMTGENRTLSKVLLKFCIDVLKMDFNVWWKNKEKDSDNGDEIEDEPLIRSLSEDGKFDKFQHVLEKLNNFGKRYDLHELLSVLLNMIYSYVAFMEDDFDRKRLRCSKSIKKTTSAEYSQYILKNSIKSEKDLIFKISLIRPPWMSVLVLINVLRNEDFQARFFIDNEKWDNSNSDLKKEQLSLIKSKILYATQTIEILPKVSNEIVLLLISRLLDTFPVHVITNSMLNEKNNTKTKFKPLYLQYLKNDKKIQKHLVFKDIGIEREKMITDIKSVLTLIKSINLSEEKSFDPSLWQYYMY